MKSRRIPLPLLVIIGTLFALPFSYLPVLTFGSVAGLHAHISLLYVLVTVSVIVSLPEIIRKRQMIWKSWPLRLLIAFTAYQTIAILWTPNVLRGCYTAAFMWLLIGFVCAVMAWYPSLKSKYTQTIWQKGLAGLAIVIAAWALWQIFADTFGLPAWTLLPADYQSGVFGVARPTGFALEPQFFGSILLIPFCWSLVQAIKTRRHVYWVYFAASFAGLLLTLSRGTLFGAFVGLVLACIILVRRWRSVCLIAGSLLIGGIAAALVIFTAGQLNTRDNLSGSDTLRRSVSQLSLGVVRLPDPQPMRATPASPPAAQKTGYVSASTDSRLSMTDRALKLWRASPSTLLFGVGSGGFGAKLHEKDASFPIGSVVNNYYVEMLAELGIVGVGLFLGFLGLLFARLIINRHWIFVVLLGALLSQMWFFSGNANIIHIWAMIGLALGGLTNHKQIKHLRTRGLVQ